MKKMWHIFAACWLILAACACARMPEEALPAVNEGGVVEGARIDVTFSVPGFSPATKGLGEGGDLSTLHLAVFGGSGYLKEYVEAFPTRIADYTYTTTDKDGNPVSYTVPCYSFTASLAMSDSPRTIHFLGNGPSTLPFGYAPAVMSMQLTANGEMGYWQMIHMDNGIRAKRNANGDFIDIHGDVIPEGGTGYIPDDATNAAFQGITLIRNWAKIELEASDDSNFSPISLAAVNVPARGSFAPYSAETGFIEDYQSKSFTYLDNTIQYPANLPAGTSFDATIPPASAFQNAPYGQGVAAADGGAVYLYERPAPSTRIPPSYVIIYGHYRRDDDLEHEGDYFYKVDLMETRQTGEGEWNSRYYPLFRNFKYLIVVKKIMSQGHATPAAAAASAGSADVSADIMTSHLSDISDGIGRLHITPWMSKTFTKANDANHPVDVLNVIFTKRNGEGNDVPDLDPDAVKVKLLPPEDGGTDIIQNLTIHPPVQSGKEMGWRNISFTTVAPGRTVRTQSIRITGNHEDGRLYRDVVISIQPIQPMSVQCSQSRIALNKGESQVITVNIPDGLVESMFPLDFIIEAEDMTLTPDNSVADNNLPVESGQSISDHSGYAGKSSFHFVKTVTWDEYFNLPRYEDDEEMMWRSFTASFKTNCIENATTVWVYNEFFDKASVTFTNYAEKYFKDLGFTTPIPKSSGSEISLYFEMITDPGAVGYPEIEIRPQGMRCISDGVTNPQTGVYAYTPTSKYVTLKFMTETSDPTEIAVYLTADEYDPGFVKAYRFRYVGLVDGHMMKSGNNWNPGQWSNVAWGYVNIDNKKNVLFGYKDDPDKLNTPVTVTIENGVTTTLEFPMTPTGPRNTAGDNNYHEIEFKSVNGSGNVTFTLSSPGYISETIDAGRFEGNIRTMRINYDRNKVFAADNTYNFSMAHPSFDYVEDSGNITVSFSQISQEPAGYVLFNAGGTYTMHIHSNNSNQTLFYVNLWFNKSGGVVFCPEDFNPSVGTINRYFGSDNQFVWSIPRGNLDATLEMTAPADRNIRLDYLYVKSFNGILYENGQRIP